MNVNIWNLDQLSQAVVNPDTDPELAIHLVHALNQLMSAIMAGEQTVSFLFLSRKKHSVLYVGRYNGSLETLVINSSGTRSMN